jgi:murein DD-endopeptidase MepM/ murein hydrolase activator NlpD
MRYYDSLGAAGYPISAPCTTMQCSYDEHLARGSRGGVDYAVRTGSPVIAPTKGRVRNWSNASAGNAVDFFHIDDNGNETGFYDQFMHLSAFVSPGVYEPGATIGFSGNTGSSTGPHIHWDLVNPQGKVVRQWEYFTNEPTKKQGSDMYYNVVTATGWQYVVTAEYVRVITGEEVPHVAHNMGAPKAHATLNDFVLWCKALNIPEDKVRALSTTNRTWSKLDTISGGGGATPAQIAAAVDASLKDDFAAIPKTVNDDVAKRMSS